MRAAIFRQGYDGGRWFYKSTKLSFTWRVWDAAFPDAQWVIVYRDHDQHLRSLMRTPFMDAYETEDEWSDFLRTYADIEATMRTCLKNVHTFYVNEVFEGGTLEVRDLMEYVGFDVDPEDVIRRCTDTTLWNGGR